MTCIRLISTVSCDWKVPGLIPGPAVNMLNTCVGHWSPNCSWSCAIGVWWCVRMGECKTCGIKHLTCQQWLEKHYINTRHLHLQALSDWLMQSNLLVMTNPMLELIAQVIYSVKRKRERTLDDEIISQKNCFLYCVNHSDNQLYFAICATHLLKPGLTMQEVECCAIRQCQNLFGLMAQTAVTFNDIGQFEQVFNGENSYILQKERQRRGFCWRPTKFRSIHSKNHWKKLCLDGFWGRLA